MPGLLCPQWVFDDYTDVTADFLMKQGVKLLLSDLDFTLAPKKQSEPDEALRKWIDGLQAAGITFAILSNNRSGVRVEKFCKPLGIGYVGHAGKPGTRADETAMLGDKLLTDALGARRSGVLMLMVEPKGGPDGAWNHVLHALQEPFKRKCPHDARKKAGNLEK